MSLDQVRAVADAVLYEGYLLYPYRATARKNQVRWQFGVLGPPAAAARGFGEEPDLACQCLLVDTPRSPLVSLRIHLRFLQLQARTVQEYDGRGDRFVPVEALEVGGEQWLSWDEAVEQERVIDCSADELRRGVARDVCIGGHAAVEEIPSATAEGCAGRVVRRRWPLRARVTVTTTAEEDHTRLEVRVANVTEEPSDPESGSSDTAIRTSLIGTHLILVAEGARFVSVVDPPREAAAASRRCVQHRCWPVLAGPRPEPDAAIDAGADQTGVVTATSSVVLASPIILYDFPEVAEQSAGALFDATEIDEILTLRVMTMTEEEKAEARATDPRAREIIDRCDALSPSDLQQLHGIWRNPHADPARAGDIRNVEPPTFGEPDVPWWDPAADEAVRPEVDAVIIDGVAVAKGSLVKVHPSRRADAQDLFFADQVARVAAVLSDVDGGVHVALVLADDPAADLHDWYGRYWYFAPDELEPLPAGTAPEPSIEHGEESRS
jgi:hypothetical protein